MLLVAPIGCGSGLIDLRARVTLDGEPVESASVTLMSSDAKRNRSAYGTTDAEGRVRFSTFQPDDGVLPGKIGYRRRDDDRWELSWTEQSQENVAILRRLRREDFLLVSRGFRWINERPFNR